MCVWWSCVLGQVVCVSVSMSLGKPPCGSQMPARVITDPLQNEENRGNLQAFWLSQTRSVSRTILDSEMKIMRGAHLDKWTGATR